MIVQATADGAMLALHSLHMQLQGVPGLLNGLVSSAISARASQMLQQQALPLLINKTNEGLLDVVASGQLTTEHCGDV